MCRYIKFMRYRIVLTYIYIDTKQNRHKKSELVGFLVNGNLQYMYI